MDIMAEQNAFTIADTYGMLPMVGTKFDPHYADEDLEYYVFAHWNGKTNVLISFHQSDLDQDRTP